MTTWDRFRDDLRRRLPVLTELDTAIIELGERFAQYQQLRTMLALNMVGNSGLSAAAALTKQEQAHLSELGWPPPDDDEPNWHLYLRWPINSRQGEQAADLLTTTIRVLLGANTPDELKIKTFNAVGTRPLSHRLADDNRS